MVLKNGVPSDQLQVPIIVIKKEEGGRVGSREDRRRKDERRRKKEKKKKMIVGEGEKEREGRGGITSRHRSSQVDVLIIIRQIEVFKKILDDCIMLFWTTKNNH